MVLSLFISFLAKANINFYFGPEMCSAFYEYWGGLKWPHSTFPLLLCKILWLWSLFLPYKLGPICTVNYHSFDNIRLAPTMYSIKMGSYPELQLWIWEESLNAIPQNHPQGCMREDRRYGGWGVGGVFRSDLKTCSGFPTRFGWLPKRSKEPTSYWVKLCNI